MSSTTSNSIIHASKAIFARHGIPETLRSNNGAQYSSHEMRDFATTYDFTHITSSPRYPQSNGLAERMVKSVKQLLQRSKNPHLALLSYRTTSLLWCNISPSELLMGRRLRTNLSIVPELLPPQWLYSKTFRNADKQFKQKQKEHFDKRHRAKELPELPTYTEVWITSARKEKTGTIVSKLVLHSTIL